MRQLASSLFNKISYHEDVFETAFRGRWYAEHAEETNEPRRNWISATTRWCTSRADCHILDKV